MIKTFLETFKNKKKTCINLKTMTGPASIMDRDEVLKKLKM
jgi:hypothetical protein